jgi:bacterioferritin
VVRCVLFFVGKRSVGLSDCLWLEFAGRSARATLGGPPNPPDRVALATAFCDTRDAMKGNPKVIAELNKALREELTAINQYFLHAEMCENWGYHKLSDFIKKQSIGEMKHAEVLIERILFLDGSPSMQPLELTVGGTVKAMIESDLALEIGAVKQYNDAVAIATKEGDNGSRDLFVTLLKDEEGHVDFLEAQVHLIKELGYERYLTQQMGADEEE